MNTIILVRHAASSGQAPDADLTREGHNQAKALVSRIAGLNPDQIYSSPYRRALATIEPFAVASGLGVSTLEGVRERTLAVEPQSDWLEHIARSFDDADYCLRGGESLNDTCDRAFQALAQITQSGAIRPVAVSHGNLIAGILNRIDPAFGFAQWRRMANPDLFKISLINGSASSFSRI